MSKALYRALSSVIIMALAVLLITSCHSGRKVYRPHKVDKKCDCPK